MQISYLNLLQFIRKFHCLVRFFIVEINSLFCFTQIGLDFFFSIMPSACGSLVYFESVFFYISKIYLKISKIFILFENSLFNFTKSKWAKKMKKLNFVLDFFLFFFRIYEYKVETISNTVHTIFGIWFW